MSRIARRLRRLFRDPLLDAEYVEALRIARASRRSTFPAAT
jgi:hypothetical protein